MLSLSPAGNPGRTGFRRLSLLAVLGLASLAATGASAAPVTDLGQPDVPPVPSVTIDAPAPTPPATEAPGIPSSATTAAPAVPEAPAADTPSPAPASDAATAAERERARAIQLARRDAARRERAATFRDVRDMLGDIGTASAAVASLDAPGTKSATRRQTSAGADTASPSPGSSDRASTLALVLLALSGVTAGIALLPLRGIGVGGHRGALSFVDRHRLELAGVSTSCLLVALLVFAGLI